MSYLKRFVTQRLELPSIILIDQFFGSMRGVVRALQVWPEDYRAVFFTSNAILCSHHPFCRFSFIDAGAESALEKTLLIHGMKKKSTRTVLWL